MDVGFGPIDRPIGGRGASPSAHRVKARSLTLGAARSRLFQVLRDLGLHRERIALRERRRVERAWEEREAARLLEERLADQQAARRLEEEVVAWLSEGEAEG